MSSLLRYPAPGCVVEFLEGNAAQIALVLEEASGKLRLLMPNRRELKLSANRLLPWLGPLYSAKLPREEAVRLLEEHRLNREKKTCAINAEETWELAQGEVDHAPAEWFAELFESAPQADDVAAYGHALLAAKGHFRFQPPDFQVFNAEMVEKRAREQKAKSEREALVSGGANFLRTLWELKCQNGQGNSADSLESTINVPPEPVATRLKELLRARMLDPDYQGTLEEQALWQILSKGLPDLPHLPLQLLTAWGELGPHHNFWLDRADYAPGDSWWQSEAGEVERLACLGRNPKNAPDLADLPFCDLPFISIDSPSTRDVDDAFHVAANENGWCVTVALAAPALCWPFGSALDRLVFHRGTSIYLPEGDCHMLPQVLGTDAFSLLKGVERPVFCLRVQVNANGSLGPLNAFAARAILAANLNYADCQAVLDSPDNARENSSPAQAHLEQLRLGLAVARAREAARISAGAVIMNRLEPLIRLKGENSGLCEHVQVELLSEPDASAAQSLVAEMMILASASLAEWAKENDLPLLHRVQDVAIPREYAGIWNNPADMARIMHALIPSSMEIEARPHAALGLVRYAPVTSPLRRYPDLLNEAQALSLLASGKPLWDARELGRMLENLQPVLYGAGQVQRFRPRYWKLLYIRQQGERVWWPGVITEENENMVSVSLPREGLFVRGRRKLFDERACPGMSVVLRLGKVNPLYNEIQILEAASAA